MKTKYVLLASLFVFFITASIFGQPNTNSNTTTITRISEVSDVMGKPVYELTVDSLSTKVWILTQVKYRELMKTTVGKTMEKMKDKNNKMDKATKDAVVTGTHYFIFDVINTSSRKEFADTSAKVEIVSPSKIASSVNLQPMKNHFGGGISLVEKGDYLFTINLNVGVGYKTSQFKYSVKKLLKNVE